MTSAIFVFAEMRRIYPLFWQIMMSGPLIVLVWFLWIYPGSGNANFLYFQTLLFIFCNLFIVVEAFGAVRRLKATMEIAERPQPPAPTVESTGVGNNSEATTATSSSGSAVENATVDSQKDKQI